MKAISDEIVYLIYYKLYFCIRASDNFSNFSEEYFVICVLDIDVYSFCFKVLERSLVGGGEQMEQSLLSDLKLEYAFLHTIMSPPIAEKELLIVAFEFSGDCF